jgi:acyl-CoA thioesterase-1
MKPETHILIPVFLIVLWPFALEGAAPSAADTRPRIVAFGDSLTAGLGVQADESYPAQLQRRLDSLGYHYRVINAGVSGDTTAGGLRRVSWILNNKPELVILELGVNDGLRGLPVDHTQSNLRQIIRQLQEAGTTVVLAGMKLPPNYGQDYTARFEALYQKLAKESQLPLIPFFLEGVGGSSSLNQADGIHPTKEGYKLIVEEVLKVLRPVLNEPAHKPSTAQKQSRRCDSRSQPAECEIRRRQPG